jgi:uncharacterized membrane protein YciS (DUF1049 family)
MRRIAFAAVLIAIVVLVAMFAYSNPEPIDVDVGVARFERVSMATVFAVVFACGWVFGLISAALALMRSARERRRLRRDLQHAETELRSLRKLP